MATGSSPEKSLLLTIGLPVFNGAKTLPAAIDSILGQTHSNFELVISDNCSTDGTDEICKRYAERDERIRYVRQSENVGATMNFKFVLDQARAPYFMWAAADDVRSADFVETNLGFLESNPDCAVSTSPNRFEGKTPEREEALVTFSLRGSIEERLSQFMDNCWESHAIFYGVMRTDTIRGCAIVGQSFFGFDWAIDFFLASRGQINRSSRGLLILGRHGISNTGNPWRPFRSGLLSWPFPFYKFSLYAWRLSAGQSWGWRRHFVIRLLRLNLESARHQLYAELFPYYLKHIRPWLKGPESK